MKTNDSYNSASHCKYLLQYHIVFCPKFRYSVLGTDIDTKLKEIISDVCEHYHYKILAMEVMPDHVHLFLSARQTVAPCDIVRTLKSITAIRLFEAFPSLKQFYARCGSLWSSGYFISSVGHVSSKTIEQYIQNQKRGD